jgi:phenylacetic acid degradation operon negative regulatory protein
MAWPALDGVLAALRAAPSRTGSVIATIYGDAILPRGGSLALADLLVLMARLGASEGVVRTAVSRLARDGVLEGRRSGRRSAYALTPAAAAEFQAARPKIYGRNDRPWDGRLRLAFPDAGADRTALDAAGFAVVAPGVLVSPWRAPGSIPCLEASDPGETARHLVARAWPVERLGAQYAAFTELFSPLLPPTPADALDAIAARIVTVHEWRRIALRDPRLPAGLLPATWPGVPARAACVTLYNALASSAEAWLNAVSGGESPLPPGDDPRQRFE